MNQTEYFIDESCRKYVEEFSDNTVRLTLYYGNARQYSIRKSGVKIGCSKAKAISNGFKEIAAKKKDITPVHGCTHYL
jgi:hypothetical protein